MSKTFKANPTTDKHNLRKRILEIESNPTTTTTTTVTKITSADVGDGLVVTDDKLNLSLGNGLGITSGDIDVKVGYGLQIVSNEINFLQSNSHFAITTSGIKLASGKISEWELRNDIWLDGTTGGNTIEGGNGTKIGIKDGSIKPVKLDILNEPMFMAMCVNRTVWREFADSSLSPSSAMGFQYHGDFQGLGVAAYDNPQFSVETFHYDGSTRLDWYRIHLRGIIKKSLSMVNNEIMARIWNLDYRPKKISSRRLPLYDVDGSSESYTDISMSIYDGKLALKILNASGNLLPGSNIDLAGVSWDTLP